MSQSIENISVVIGEATANELYATYGGNDNRAYITRFGDICCAHPETFQRITECVLHLRVTDSGLIIESIEQKIFKEPAKNPAQVQGRKVATAEIGGVVFTVGKPLEEISFTGRAANYQVRDFLFAISDIVSSNPLTPGLVRFPHRPLNACDASARPGQVAAG